MILNYILAAAAGLFFILCILSVMAEHSPSDKAFSRNIFRGLKITLREIGLLLFIIIAAILIVAALNGINSILSGHPAPLRYSRWD